MMRRCDCVIDVIARSLARLVFAGREGNHMPPSHSNNHTNHLPIGEMVIGVEVIGRPERNGTHPEKGPDAEESLEIATLAVLARAASPALSRSRAPKVPGTDARSSFLDVSEARRKRGAEAPAQSLGFLGSARELQPRSRCA